MALCARVPRTLARVCSNGAGSSAQPSQARRSSRVLVTSSCCRPVEVAAASRSSPSSASAASSWARSRATRVARHQRPPCCHPSRSVRSRSRAAAPPSPTRRHAAPAAAGPRRAGRPSTSAPPTSSTGTPPIPRCRVGQHPAPEPHAGVPVGQELADRVAGSRPGVARERDRVWSVSARSAPRSQYARDHGRPPRRPEAGRVGDVGDEVDRERRAAAGPAAARRAELPEAVLDPFELGRLVERHRDGRVEPERVEALEGHDATLGSQLLEPQGRHGGRRRGGIVVEDEHGTRVGDGGDTACRSLERTSPTRSTESSPRGPRRHRPTGSPARRRPRPHHRRRRGRRPARVGRARPGAGQGPPRRRRGRRGRTDRR